MGIYCGDILYIVCPRTYAHMCVWLILRMRFILLKEVSTKGTSILIVNTESGLFNKDALMDFYLASIRSVSNTDVLDIALSLWYKLFMRLTTRRREHVAVYSFIRDSSSWNGFNRFQKCVLQFPKWSYIFSFLRGMPTFIVLTLDRFDGRKLHFKKLRTNDKRYGIREIIIF